MSAEIRLALQLDTGNEKFMSLSPEDVKYDVVEKI